MTEREKRPQPRLVGFQFVEEEGAFVGKLQVGDEILFYAARSYTINGIPHTTRLPGRGIANYEVLQLTLQRAEFNKLPPAEQARLRAEYDALSPEEQRFHGASGPLKYSRMFIQERLETGYRAAVAKKEEGNT